MKVSTITGTVLAATSIVFVALLAGIGAEAVTDDPPAVDPYARDTSSPEAPAAVAGADLYARHCARCHAEDLSGGRGPALGPGSSAAGMAEADLRTVIEQGRGAMPAWDDRLTPGEVESLIEFLQPPG